jgi:hypothetical protein
VSGNNGRRKDREFSELLGEDVLETPDKNVENKRKTNWTYGTIGL